MEKILSQIKSNISTYVPSFPFRKGQGPVYSAIIETLSKGITSMYIEGPTGMGKTFIESVIADAMMADSRNLKTLLLTSKVNLLDQISKELTRFIPHRSHSLYGGSHRDLSGEIVVMTYASYNKISQKNRDRFNIVLMDEAHKGLGDLTRANLTKHRENAVTIGFTASSSYSGTKNLQEFLGEEVYKISIREAIKMGMLCAVQLSMVDIDIEISEKKNSETQGEYDQRLASEIIRKGGNIAAAKLFRSAFKKRNLRGIMFTLTVRQGKDLVRSLQKEGVRARLITAKTKQKDRKILFDSFKRHEFDVLVGIGVIKEGFDDPGVAVSMFVYPAKSYVDIIQGNGRVLRINDLNPNKLAYVVMPNFVGQKGQVFYHELLDGVSFQEPDENPGDYDYLTRDEIDSFNIGIIKKVSITHEEFLQINASTKNDEVNLSDIKIELAKHGIKSQQTLSNYGPIKFIKTKFEGSYMGSAYAARILGKRLYSKVSHKHLNEISKKLGWKVTTKKEQVILWKMELKVYGIDSYLSLTKFGPIDFKQAKFGKYGYGQAFAGLILGRVVYNVTSTLLIEICSALGWKPPTDEEKILDYRFELSKHGIFSEEDLLKCGITKFRDLRFDSYKKNGRGFISVVLNRSISESSYKKDLLFEMINVLFH